MAIGQANLNLGDAQSLDAYNNSPLPKGSYQFLAVKWEDRTSQSGVMSVNFNLAVIEGPMKGRQFWLDIPYHDGTPDSRRVKYGKAILNGFKDALPTLSWSQINEALMASIVGKRVMIDLEIEPESTNKATGKVYAARNKAVKIYAVPSHTVAPGMGISVAPVAGGFGAPAGVAAPAYAPSPAQYQQPASVAYAPPPAGFPVQAAPASGSPATPAGYASPAPAPAPVAPMQGQPPSFMAPIQGAPGQPPGMGGALN